MKKLLPILIATVCAASSLLGADETRSAPELLTVEGVVEVLPAGESTWDPGKPGTPLKVNDRVRTGRKSRAAVRLFDASVLRIGELTTFHLLPAAQGQKPVIDIKSGSLYFFSRQKPDQVRFHTPTVSGAIRGTEFVVRVAESGETEVALIDGKVLLESADESLEIASGEAVTAAPGKKLERTSLLNARTAIQWVLYYPAVVNPDDLGLKEDEKNTVTDSLAQYREGNLLEAGRIFRPESGRSCPALSLYSAALELANGNVPAVEAALRDNNGEPAARALQTVISAILQSTNAAPGTTNTSSELLANSYFYQSRGDLGRALSAARQATEVAPGFGYAWVRLGELQFAHGNLDLAKAALEKGLQISPANAAAIALKGYILSGQNKWADASETFSRAIAQDGALGSAWLGRGLARIALGDQLEGRQDIQTAAALEPQRSVFRSYLARAFANEKEQELAAKDLRLAKALDPNDPTPWLYSGIINQEKNRINDAVEDLQKSIELNDNRLVYRSEFLLDQDRATRQANLASIYRDAEMLPVSVNEASRSVTYDYANYSSHLYLAQSYALFQDPKRFNLRYENTRISELYMTSLLSPVGGFNLSQNTAIQDANRLFPNSPIGLSSETEYFSNKEWSEAGSQFGTFGSTAYSLDARYHTDAGQRVNNDLEQRELSAQFKQQITPSDSIYFRALQFESEAGDIQQRFDQSTADPDFRVRERHEPDLFAGYHHEWNPGVHTLFFAGRIDSELEQYNEDAPMIFFRPSGGGILPQFIPGITNTISREYELYSAELQQIWQTARQNYIVGARYQGGGVDTEVFLDRGPFGSFTNNVSGLEVSRLSLYGYHQWQIIDPLHITAGLSYDRLRSPANVDLAPIVDEELEKSQLAPKAGLVWNPWERGAFKFAFTRSLGGAFGENSLRLEPTQIGGFNQAYRSLIPESAAGIVSGEEFQTFSVGFDQTLFNRTFLGVALERLESEGERDFGVFRSTGFPVPSILSTTREQLDFREDSIRFYAYQLLGEYFVAGGNYRLASAELNRQWPELSPAAPVPGLPSNRVSAEATLHQLDLNLTFNHPSGLFSTFESQFTAQTSGGDFAPADSEFWQHHFFVGYRFYKRAAEVRLGILNLANQDYQLNPLNLHAELPRERTFTARLRLNF